jgi:hypothetical protein
MHEPEWWAPTWVQGSLKIKWRKAKNPECSTRHRRFWSIKKPPKTNPHCFAFHDFVMIFACPWKVGAFHGCKMHFRKLHQTSNQNRQEITLLEFRATMLDICGYFWTILGNCLPMQLNLLVLIHSRSPIEIERYIETPKCIMLLIQMERPYHT